MPVFERAGQVRVTRPQPGDRLRREALLLGRHLRLPVLVVAVLEDQRHRAAQRGAPAHAPHDPGLVNLDLLPAPAPVSALPAAEVRPEVVGGELKACGHSLDDHRQLRPVRLPGREPAKHTRIIEVS